MKRKTPTRAYTNKLMLIRRFNATAYHYYELQGMLSDIFARADFKKILAAEAAGTLDPELSGALDYDPNQLREDIKFKRSV